MSLHQGGELNARNQKSREYRKQFKSKLHSIAGAILFPKSADTSLRMDRVGFCDAA